MFVLVPTGDLSSQSSDTLMSLRTTPIPQVVSVGSAGVRYPAGSLGCVVVQYVRPVPSEPGRGRLSRSSLLRGSLLHGGLVLIAFQSVTPVRASPNTAVN